MYFAEKIGKSRASVHFLLASEVDEERMSRSEEGLACARDEFEKGLWRWRSLVKDDYFVDELMRKAKENRQANRRRHP